MALNVSTSIVDYLKSTGKDSSFGARANMANQYGIQGYTGTAEQNVALLQKLQSAPAVSPANMPSTPKPVVPSQLAVPVDVPKVQNLVQQPQQQQPQQQTGTGSMANFMSAFNQLNSKGQELQGLQDQKNKLLQQLYDQPLTDQDLTTLSPTQQEAIRNGNKSLIEFQIRSINDIIKGRQNQNGDALKYMIEGYQADLKAAEEARAQADKKRDDSRSLILGLADKYGSLANLDQADWDALQKGEITPQIALKLGDTIASQKSANDMLSPTEAASLGVPYGTTKTAAQLKGIIPKSELTGTQKTTLELKISKDFQTYTQPARTAIRFGKEITNVFNAAKDSNFTQQAMIMAYNKILDTQSVVRETEYARTGEGQDKLSEIQGKIEKLGAGGAGLTKESLQDMVNVTQELLSGYVMEQLNYAGLVENQVKSNNLDINNVLTPEDKRMLDAKKGFEKIFPGEDFREALVSAGNDIDKIYAFLDKKGAFNQPLSTGVNGSISNKFPEGSKGGQCGDFAHKITEFPSVGDSLAQKQSSANKYGMPLEQWKASPQVGDVILSADNNTYGHVSVINSINPDGSVILSESNYKGDEKITHNRLLDINSPLIFGVIRGNLKV